MSKQPNPSNRIARANESLRLKRGCSLLFGAVNMAVDALMAGPVVTNGNLRAVRILRQARCDYIAVMSPTQRKPLEGKPKTCGKA